MRIRNGSGSIVPSLVVLWEAFVAERLTKDLDMSSAMPRVGSFRCSNHRTSVAATAHARLPWGIFVSMSYLLRAKLPNLGGRHRFCRTDPYDDRMVPSDGNSNGGSYPPTRDGGLARARRSGMRRLLRWRLFLSVLVLGLSAVLIGGWQFTRSEAAAQLVCRKLEERLGTTTQFERLSVGVTNTSVSGLKIYEHGTPPESEPFVDVGEVKLDLSVLGAIRGDSPSAITFRDAHVLLRFDRKGDLK